MAKRKGPRSSLKVAKPLTGSRPVKVHPVTGTTGVRGGVKR